MSQALPPSTSNIPTSNHFTCKTTARGRATGPGAKPPSSLDLSLLTGLPVSPLDSSSLDPCFRCMRICLHISSLILPPLHNTYTAYLIKSSHHA